MVDALSICSFFCYQITSVNKNMHILTPIVLQIIIDSLILLFFIQLKLELLVLSDENISIFMKKQTSLKLTYLIN